MLCCSIVCKYFISIVYQQVKSKIHIKGANSNPLHPVQTISHILTILVMQHFCTNRYKKWLLINMKYLNRDREQNLYLMKLLSLRDQMSFEEYTYIFNIVKKKNGCNFLIFGTGNDSPLWMDSSIGSNINGKSIFLENDNYWIDTVKINYPNMDIRLVHYTDRVLDANRLLIEYENGKNNLKLELDDDIRNTKWDVILVDAPHGYKSTEHGRMKSIYESYSLSKYNDQVDIFVHDCERQVENLYVDYFLKDYELIKELDNNRHGILRHYRK